MSRIFLVRHGEVEGNSGERPTFAGWADKPLTPRGVQQAEAVARRLAGEKLHAVYSSDLQRARVTAERIATPHGLLVQSDPAWREVNYGAWEGLGQEEILASWAEVWQQRVADPENIGPPDGESYADLWRRLGPAWQSLVARHAEAAENAVVVAHNGTVRVLLCYLLGMPVANYRRIHVNNTGVSCVEVGPGGMRVRFMNETCHLKDI